MSTQSRPLAILAFLLLLTSCNWGELNLDAQGTAFTYQGRLQDNGTPANGSYDFKFSVYDTNQPVNNLIAGPVTNAATIVSNGLFTLTLDFGQVFNGNARWLEIGVQTNGGSGFNLLSPRQQLTPVPYAIYAATASNVSGTVSASQLSGLSSVSLNQFGGPLALAQLPGLVLTNNASGVNLAGTFNGEGALLWQVVSSTSQQAQPNQGYLVPNGLFTTITLPGSAAVADVLRISGGNAGWQITQNANQSISGGGLVGNLGAVWGPLPYAPSNNWSYIVSSADGSKLAAGTAGGLIYTSPDFGVTWTAQPGSPTTNWDALASSADGTKLAGVVGDNTGSFSQVWLSSDSGVTWTAQSGVPSANAYSIACSADGTRLVVGNNPNLYTSTNSGLTWTAQTNGVLYDGYQTWNAVASSADGTRLIAVSDLIYTSTNSGATWMPQINGIGHSGYQNWIAVASSTNGNNLVAAVLTQPSVHTAGIGGIYTSTNAGVTWQLQTNGLPNGGVQIWFSVASSADGSRLIAAVNGGQIYVSTNYGLNWTARAGTHAWHSVASSADGSKLLAIWGNGQIYSSIPVSVPGTTPGTAGYLLGGPKSAIELQYFGNNQFIPISHEGAIQAY
jgi:hypothetical protein